MTTKMKMSRVAIETAEAVILQLHPDVVVVCDEAALSKLVAAGVPVCK